MNTLKSKISKVTVYSDRAQITRVAKTTTEKGEHVFRFEDLPESIEEKSIQVNGLGNVLLKEIKYKNVYFEKTQNKKLGVLQTQLVELQYLAQDISDKISHAKKEKEFMENIVVKITGESRKSAEMNPENWIKMVDFYRSKLDSLDKEIRVSEKELITESQKSIKIKKEISALSGNNGKTQKIVDVTVEANDSSEIALALTYIVYGPSWLPTYNVRVSSENKKVLVEYNALITQQTNEDWENIALTISTAKVQVGGNVPVLSPWYVAKYVPTPPLPQAPIAYKKKRGSRKKSLVESGKMMKSMSIDAFAGAVPELEVEAIMEKPKIQTEEKATSTTYTIAGNTTIISNSDTHKTGIGVLELNADFEYTIVPKLSTFAYLKAEVTNKSNYVFLAGTANVFFDSSFVTETKLKTVHPEEKFNLSLGVDEGIKTEHKIIPAFNKDEGIFNKKHKKTYEFETIIKNNKKTDEKVKLIQHIPVSNNDDISVKLKEPDYKEDSEILKINKQGIVKRDFDIKTKDELKVELKFVIEYPRDMIVTGLE